MRTASSYSGIIARSSLRTSAQRNGSATVPRTRFERASAASTGFVFGPSFIFCFSPAARSIGGCRRHVTFVPGPPTAS